MQVFEKIISVSSDDIDHLNHVNNIRYIKWIQQIANEHWNSLTTDIQRKNYVWVVIRHEIDYKSPAYVGDILTLKTYVSKCSGVTCIREVEIINNKNSMLLVKSKTNWCMTNPNTKKPKRIPTDLLTLFD